MPAVKREEATRFIVESVQTKKGYVVGDSFAAPAAASNTSVLAAQTLPTSGTTTVSSGFTQPDMARTLRFKGNQATTQGLVLTINGTDKRGNVISEALTMGGAFATPTDSVNAFASVTSIVFPTRGGASDTISVGVGIALGLSRKLFGAVDAGISATTDGVYEATRPTFTAHATFSRNVVSTNTAPNAAKNFKVFYISDELYAGAN